MDKLLKNIRIFFTHGHNARTTIILDGSKEKCGYNEKVSCNIKNCYTCHNVNDTFLLDQ